MTDARAASDRLTLALLNLAARGERHKRRVMYQGASQRRPTYEQ